MRKPRIKLPQEPTASLKKHIGNAIGKKYRSVIHRPKRTITSGKNYTKLSHYNPKKAGVSYAKNYYKNFTLPLARPYRKAKAIYGKTKKFLKPLINYNKEYAKQLGKYQKRVEKYNNAGNKYRNYLEEQKVKRKEAKESFKKNFGGFTKKEDVNLGEWGSEVSGVSYVYDRGRDEKIREMKKKGNKEQLFYVPRMDLEGYNAIQISPERIGAYYKGEAQELFPTVEVFREFLDDYFSLGGFISKGVSSMILGKLESVGTTKILKEVAKYTKILALL